MKHPKSELCFQKVIVTQFCKKLRTSWKLFLLLQDKMKMQKFNILVAFPLLSFQFTFISPALAHWNKVQNGKRFLTKLCGKQQCQICCLKFNGQLSTKCNEVLLYPRVGKVVIVCFDFASQSVDAVKTYFTSCTID